MDPISDEEFLATPLNVLANDPLPQSPNSKFRLEPERSIEFDNLRQIKHADPYGRITLGRRYSYQSFIVEELTQGSLLLRPAVIMEKRCLDKLQQTRPQTAGHPVYLRIPTMR